MLAEVDTVVWATGFRPDFGWVGFPVTDETGWPAGSRGVSSAAPGLYYVGMPFQSGLTSGLLGGVGRDAAYVAGRMARAQDAEGGGSRAAGWERRLPASRAAAAGPRSS